MISLTVAEINNIEYEITLDITPLAQIHDMDTAHIIETTPELPIKTENS
jgi:hypothetical protein